MIKPPTLTGLNLSVTFDENTVNAAPQVLDAGVVFGAGDAGFDGGNLSVSGLLSEDIVSVRSLGNGPGQIGLNGTSLRYEGTGIGTLSGGVGTTLTITFNAAVTVPAIDALIQNLTYTNSSDTPTATRDLFLNVTDAAGEDLVVSPPDYTELTGSNNPFEDVDVRGSSAPAFVDLDGDGDLDLVVGDFYGTLNAFENEDGSYTERTGSDNPFDGIDVDGPSTPSFVDLDGDGELYLVVGDTFGALHLFEQDGDSYEELTGFDNPFDGIDVGDNSAPTFVDIDADGDPDLVVGDDDGTFTVFENDEDSFIELTGGDDPLNGISVNSESKPVFVDVDGDRDLDLVVGDGFGDLRVFENDEDSYEELTGADNPLNTIGVAGSGAPSFVDIDEDGDLDVILGNQSGTLQVFDNVRPLGIGVTVAVTPESDAPVLNGLSPSVTFAENTVNASPQLLDADVLFTDPNDNFDGGSLSVSGLLAEDTISVRDQGNGPGQIGLSGGNVSFAGTVIGTLSGGAGATLTIAFNAAATSAGIQALIENLTYANSSDMPTASRDLLLNVTDAAGDDLVVTAPFIDRTGTGTAFDGIDVGSNSAPSFVDLDGDGDLDLVVGESYGTLRVFDNDGSTFNELTGGASPFASIDVGNNNSPSFTDLDGDGDLDLIVGASDGTLTVFDNNGGNYTELTGANDPLNGFGVPLYSAPVFADFDGDGDQDLVVGQFRSIQDPVTMLFSGGSPLLFENDGGLFTQVTGTDNPLAAINIGFFGTPSFTDLDGDGDLDLVAGELYGTLNAFEYDGGTYTALTGADTPFNGIDVGDRSHPEFIDLDGDGDQDLIVGAADGTLKVYENPRVDGLVLSVAVTPESDAPMLTGLDNSFTFAENTVNAAPQLLDTDVVFTDPNDNFDGGTLSVSGLLAEDTVLVRDQGNGPGQIGLSGNTVSFGGTVIGTLSGGSGTTLTIAFNAAATSAGIDALIENLTYANSSDTPTASRDLMLDVADAAGDVPSFVAFTGTANPLAAFNVGIFSSPSFVDLDGDGDLDLVVGEYYGTLKVFDNNGGAFTALTGTDNPFDAINVGNGAAPVFSDLDGDGDLDLVVGAVDGTFKLFDNTGGVFTQLIGAANPFDSIDVGYDSKPSFADVDGDGDLDLTVGDVDGKITLFDNDGGVFIQRTGGANPFDSIDVGYSSTPSFSDLDGDGDLDLVVGAFDGTFKAFDKDGLKYTALTGGANPLDGIDVGYFSTPSFADLDGDSDLDLIAGEIYGDLLSFDNPGPRASVFTVEVTSESDGPSLGTLSPVTFAENTVNATPQILLSQVSFDDPNSDFDGGTLTVSGLLAEDTVSLRNVGNGSGEIGFNGSVVSFEGQVIGTVTGGVGSTLTVTFNDKAVAGSIDLLIEALTYANASDTPTLSRDLVLNVTDETGADLSPLSAGGPSFAPQTGAANPFDGIDVGMFSAPGFADLDGDGDLDLVVGNSSGTLNVFENDGGAYTAQTGAANPFDSIDVGSYSAAVFVDLDGDGDLDLVVGNSSGTLNVFDNDGGVYTAQTGIANPFDGIDVESFSKPSFADLDGDGDLDLVVGERFGTLSVFDNDGGAYTAQTGAANPFDGIDVVMFSTPTFADLDGDGDLDLVVGDYSGTLNVFDNDGGAYTAQTGAANPFDGIDDGNHSAPSFADLDGDGDLDLVVGNTSGTLNVFEDTALRGVVLKVDVTPEDDTSVPPTVTGLPGKVGVLEDDPSALDLSAVQLTFSNMSAALVVTLTASGGTLVAADAGGVSVSGAGTGSLVLTGTAAAIDGYLNDPAALRYTGASNVFGPDAAILSLSADDGSGPVALGTVNIDIADTPDTQTGDDEPNPLTGDEGVDVLIGLGGNDTLNGRGGNDTIEGGRGDDTINGNAGADTIDGGDDNDTINGGIGPDTIDGGDGVDTITGGDGFDTLNGGTGNDTIRGNAGNDTINGEDGDDILNGGIGSDTIDGGADNDTINGNDGFDILSGGAGDDTINGNAGNDTIRGGDGDDTLNGGIGFDTIFGENGDDTIFGLEGFDTLSGGAGRDTIQGNAGNDQIDAGADDDFVEGGQGADTILGGTGNDTLRGQTGGDTISGGDGDDTVLGGEGADRLSGDADDDMLTGGAGADVFVFNDGKDTITDYSVLVDGLELDAVALEIVGLTGAQVVTEFGEIVAGDTVLTFDTGDILTLNGITNSAAVLGGTIDVIGGM